MAKNRLMLLGFLLYVCFGLIATKNIVVHSDMLNLMRAFVTFFSGFSFALLLVYFYGSSLKRKGGLFLFYLTCAPLLVIWMVVLSQLSFFSYFGRHEWSDDEVSIEDGRIYTSTNHSDQYQSVYMEKKLSDRIYHRKVLCRHHEENQRITFELIGNDKVKCHHEGEEVVHEIY